MTIQSTSGLTKYDPCGHQMRLDRSSFPNCLVRPLKFVSKKKLVELCYITKNCRLWSYVTLCYLCPGVLPV